VSALPPPRRPVALALMVVAPMLWSMAGVVTRHVERAAPFEQVFWRSFAAGVFVAAFLPLAGSNPWRAVRAAGLPGLFSGTMWAVMFTAFVLALSLTSTANTLVVMSVSPLLTAALARLLLKEPVPPRTWLAILAGAAGIGWMFAAGLGMHSPRDAAGMLVAMLVPVAAASNLIALRATAARLDLVPALIVGALLSCLIALPLALPFGASARDLLLLGFLGVFQLGLPCILLVIASRSLRAPEIALLGLIEVVLGPLWAWLGAGETPGTATLAGGAIVLAALVANELSALATRKRAP
jgi:drug/metabolite transporter (DMT)-like permease